MLTLKPIMIFKDNYIKHYENESVVGKSLLCLKYKLQRPGRTGCIVPVTLGHGIY